MCMVSYPRLRFSFALRQCKHKVALVCAPWYVQQAKALATTLLYSTCTVSYAPPGEVV